MTYNENGQYFLKYLMKFYNVELICKDILMMSLVNVPVAQRVEGWWRRITAWLCTAHSKSKTKPDSKINESLQTSFAKILNEVRLCLLITGKKIKRSNKSLSISLGERTGIVVWKPSAMGTPWNLREWPWQSLLVTVDVEPEPGVFCNQARPQMEELGHQPSHKPFDL